MARLIGYAAQVRVDNDGGGAPAEFVGSKDWALSIKGAAVDVSAFDGAGVKSFLAGQKEWAGTCGGVWDDTEGDIYGAPPLVSVGQRIELELWLFYDIGGTERYKGDALVTAFDPKVGVDGAVEWSLGFQGTEALTYPT